MIDTLRIESNLDVGGSAYITRLLYYEVAQGRIKFELKSKEGSVDLKIAIDVLSEVYQNIFSNLSVGDLISMGGLGVYLIKNLYKWMKKEKDKGRHLPPIKIKRRTKEVIITGSEMDWKEIRVTEIKEDYELQ